MKVTGSHTVRAPRHQVFDALHDPAVLARTLPGCQQLEVTGEDAYTATVHAGVASVKGTYRGSVTLLDQVAPERYRMRAQGAGTPGTISADVVIRLEEDGDVTVVSYDGDAVVGGMIGGVGQRMLLGVAGKTAGEFFDNVERELTGATVAVGEPWSGVEPAPSEEGAPSAAAGAPAPAGAPALGTVFPGAPPAAPTPGRPVELLVAALVGAAIALAGVLVGRRSAR